MLKPMLLTWSGLIWVAQISAFISNFIWDVKEQVQSTMIFTLITVTTAIKTGLTIVGTGKQNVKLLYARPWEKTGLGDFINWMNEKNSLFNKIKTVNTSKNDNRLTKWISEVQLFTHRK